MEKTEGAIPAKSVAIWLLAVGLMVSGHPLWAQCSDAGGCALGRHAEVAPEGPRHQAAVRYLLGNSGKPDEVRYNAVRIDLDLQVFRSTRVTASLPYNTASGPLGTSSGMGDLILVWNQLIMESESVTLTAQAGARIGTGDANAKPGLPMAYQPGLGETDILLGTYVQSSAWTVGAGYQIAGGRNTNSLVRLERGDDLLVWGGYSYGTDRWGIKGQIVMIKRLAESSVRDTAAAGDFVTVPGSDELQLNLGVRGTYAISEILSVEVAAVIPTLKRDVNVDGLKRAFTFSGGVLVAF
jgi:hypothetical protein